MAGDIALLLQYNLKNSSGDWEEAKRRSEQFKKRMEYNTKLKKLEIINGTDGKTEEEKDRLHKFFGS